MGETGETPPGAPEPLPRSSGAGDGRGGTEAPAGEPSTSSVRPPFPPPLPLWLEAPSAVADALARRGAEQEAALALWDGVRVLALLCEAVATRVPVSTVPLSKALLPHVLRVASSLADDVHAARELLALMRPGLPATSPRPVPTPTAPDATGNWLMEQAHDLVSLLGAPVDADPEALRGDLARTTADLSAHFDAWAALLAGVPRDPWKVPPV